MVKHSYAVNIVDGGTYNLSCIKRCKGKKF